MRGNMLLSLKYILHDDRNDQLELMNCVFTVLLTVVHFDIIIFYCCVEQEILFVFCFVIKLLMFDYYVFQKLIRFRIVGTA